MAIPWPRTRGGSGISKAGIEIAGHLERNCLDRNREIAMNMTCPNCQSSRTHRSKTKGMVEIVVAAIIFRRPFRCEECDERFFRWSISEKRPPERPVTSS